MKPERKKKIADADGVVDDEESQVQPPDPHAPKDIQQELEKLGSSPEGLSSAEAQVCSDTPERIFHFKSLCDLPLKHYLDDWLNMLCLYIRCVFRRGWRSMVQMSFPR